MSQIDPIDRDRFLAVVCYLVRPVVRSILSSRDTTRRPLVDPVLSRSRWIGPRVVPQPFLSIPHSSDSLRYSTEATFDERFVVIATPKRWLFALGVSPCNNAVATPDTLTARK